jgi:hypothetical protein
MAFRIGQLVVCIDDSIQESGIVFSKRLHKPFLLRGDLNGLTRGQIYTVRGIDLDWVDEKPVLFLEEIIRPKLHHEHAETGFLASRFRPVQERKSQTDISIFLKMLSPKKVDA